LLSLTAGVSLLVAFDSRHDGSFFELLSLWPAQIWRAQLWRLASWPFIEPGPIGLIFTCLFLYWFGRDLSDVWGSRRFLLVFATIVLVAGLGTSLVGLVDPPVLDRRYVGGWALTAALTVAWGLAFPERVVRIYFVLPIRGYWLAWLTVGITIVYAVYTGWQEFLPELFAEAGMLGWMFRGRVAAKLRALRVPSRSSGRPGPGRPRGRGADYLRVVSSREDDDDEPLPPEVERKIDDILGRGPKPGNGPH
jgi:membrane associated rhomboid family serine protease